MKWFTCGRRKHIAYTKYRIRVENEKKDESLVYIVFLYFSIHLHLHIYTHNKCCDKRTLTNTNKHTVSKNLTCYLLCQLHRANGAFTCIYILVSVSRCKSIVRVCEIMIEKIIR